MAKCKFCNQEMRMAEGCVEVPVNTALHSFTPIPFKAMNGERCHDCNCKDGMLHHPGCDMERCPNCGGQLISCGCLWAEETKST